MRTLLLLVAACGLAAARLGAQAPAVATMMEVLAVASADPATSGGLSSSELVLTPGQDASVPPADGAQMRFTFNVATTVTLPASVVLLNEDEDELPITLTCAEAPGGDDPAPSGFSCPTGFTTSTAGGTSEWWLYVGAEIAGAATQGIPPGIYQTEVVVTLSW